MTRCTDCWNKTAYCTCWIPTLSKRCHWCFHFMDYCTCPDMAEARSNIKNKMKGLLMSFSTAERETPPLFGYCHPDNYERYSKVIADYFMSPEPNWQQALLDDLMRQYDKVNGICITCLKRPTHCTCEKKHPDA